MKKSISGSFLALFYSYFRVAHHVETCTSAERLEMLSKASNAWDGEIKLISKHSETLQQLDSGKIVNLNLIFIIFMLGSHGRMEM